MTPGTLSLILYEHRVCGIFNVPENLCVQGLWDRAYGLSSLSEKTRKSNCLQTSSRRRLFLPTYSKTLSVGQAMVWDHSLLHGRPSYQIELIHTFLTYWTSGWYLGGINIMINLSTSWIPDSEHTPRYKSTPNITGTGMRLSAGAKRIEIPVTQVKHTWKCV